MAEETARWVLLFLLLMIFYAYGYWRGKKSRKIDLSGLGAQEAFAFFLTHEIHRHRQDIAKVKEDLKKLDRAGFHAPDIPVGLWIEVVTKRGTIVPGKGTR